MLRRYGRYGTNAYGNDATTIAMAGMDASDMFGQICHHMLDGLAWAIPMHMEHMYATRSYGWYAWSNDASYAS